MRYLRVCLVLSAVCVLLMGCWPAQAGSNRQIRGGRSVGPVRLGVSLEAVRSVLGNPEKVDSSPNDPRSKFLRYPQQGLAVFVGSNGKVIGITVTSSAWRTPEGIGVGSAASSVTSTYGRGLVRGKGNVNYAQRGLAFSMRSGKVSSVFVFAPEEERALLGDRIIVPGKRVGGIAIGFPVAKVNQAWGQADQVSAMGQSGRALYRWKEEAVGLIAYGGKVEGMVLETGDFITSQGVKVGSSKTEVIKAMGGGYVTQQERILYEKKGIGFLFCDGRVQQITVLAPAR